MAVIRDSTIDAVLAERAATLGGHVAVRCGDVAVSYSDLAIRSEAFGRWLIEAGIQPGDRVALWLPNGIPWVVAHVAIAMAGGVCVPVSTRLVEREANYILTHSESKVVVVADRFLNRDYAAEACRLTEKLPDTFVLAIDLANGKLPSGAAHTRLPGSRPDDAAIIQYTSGTTGVPKGCILSHRAWTNNARLSPGVAGVSSDDVILCPSPFFHLFGSLTGLMGSLSVGASFVTVPTFDRDACIRAIRSLSVTRLVAVPTVWLDLMSATQPGDLPTVQGGVWGGAGFPRAALERAMDLDGYGWNLQAIYGMTEAPTLTQIRPDDPMEHKLDSVGRATPELEVRIVDLSTEEPMGQGGIGEIWAKGYNRMLGYLKDHAATDARFHGEWIRSGDLGTLDDQGFLRVVGRLTDMILVGGANVYTREVEDVLMELEGVLMAAVVGRDDPRLGEVPVAWIVPVADVQVDETVVVAHCKKNLAGYKVPREFYIVPKIPLTGSGKIHKALLRERANSRTG